MTTGIVTCASSDMLAFVQQELPDVMLHARPTPETTTFANTYELGFRTQYLHARADTLSPHDLPLSWHDAPIVLFGPLAQEIPISLIECFQRRTGVILAATPQGWLRQWDKHGRVRPTPWENAEQVLPLLDVLVLSHDDLLPFAQGDRAQADALLMEWSHHVPLLVATGGRRGATLFQYGATQDFPAYSAREVDPTGAGDVFAAAFLVHLARQHTPQEAVNFANCAASFSIEHPGLHGIPSQAMVETRLQL
jgi:sugar/nucleoside kinase (ribokinase family)